MSPIDMGRLRRAASAPALAARSLRARRYAARRGAPGTTFGRFGANLGAKLLLDAKPAGLRQMLAPVASLRYFEFDAAKAMLPDGPGRCLDLGSPRLFSLFVAERHPDADITIVNPDQTDLDETRDAAKSIKLTNVGFLNLRVEDLPDDEYECIWSISVVEHIAGQADDSDAVRACYSRLAPGGRLILTVPVGRRYEDEYREVDPYGTQAANDDGRYFFQRVYDEDAVHARLLGAVARPAAGIRWFGEIQPGRFRRHEDRWREIGWPAIVEDAREIADGYREFSSWSEMPGFGVCAFAIEKPGA